MIMCGYGCGQEAKYPPRKGKTKWSCEKDFRLCPCIIKIKSEKMKIQWSNQDSKINSDVVRKKRKLRIKKSWDNNQVRKEKLKESLKQRWKVDGGCYRNKKYIDNIKKRTTLQWKSPDIKKEMIKNISMSRKLSIKYIKRKYPLFSKIEELRYNPDKPGEKEIQVHCKNHNCPNSKEQGGWFTITYIQFYERIRGIEKTQNDGSYFYCCEECKQDCPLYGVRGNDPFEDKDLPYNFSEIQIWKQVVLKQDNYECQMCGAKENLQCHHIIPVKIESMFALDPDNGIVLCKNCHYKYGHKTETECSTGNLAAKQC